MNACIEKNDRYIYIYPRRIELDVCGLLYDPGRVDDDIHRSQIRPYLSHRVRDRLLVPDVDVVEPDRKARRRAQFGGRGLAEVAPQVQQGDGSGAGFGERL